jgi:hypothetical protein
MISAHLYIFGMEVTHWGEAVGPPTSIEMISEATEGVVAVQSMTDITCYKS